MLISFGLIFVEPHTALHLFRRTEASLSVSACVKEALVVVGSSAFINIIGLTGILSHWK